jgi:filamentous hemagglutinin family protein
MVMAKTYLKIVLSAVCLWNACAPKSVQSQIIPDTTLPVNSVVNNNDNINTIAGGTTAGTNLFHSFSEFSLSTGGEAFFNHASEINNILTRVTGSNISNIDGLIRTNGTANLFLLNPNGIVFGPNAQLNIGGSFLASSAASLVMDDGSLFSATDPQAPPLLTVNVPVGLQFGNNNPGAIVNQSQVTNTEGTVTGLAVTPGQTLGLVGGQLTLDGGQVTAPQGQIYLVAVDSRNRVSSPKSGEDTEIVIETRFLAPEEGFALGYSGVENFGDIQLTNNATVNASGNGGGSIAVRGSNVTLTNGSSLVSNTVGSDNGGDIKIDATQFLLDNGAFVSVSTFGTGAGGNLFLNASDRIDLNGTERLIISEQILGGRFNPLELSSGLYAFTVTNAPAGDININTRQLRGNNGLGILASTFGPGSGGNLAIAADELVDISGGSLLISGTTSSGQAGDLTIDTQNLTLEDGSVISSTTFGSGQGGNLVVRASEKVELIGAPADRLASTEGTSRLFRILPTAFVSGSAGPGETGTGFGGDIIIDTQKLIVRDGALISAASTSAGRGGTLSVDASDSVEVTGVSTDGLLPSSLLASASGTIDNAGDIIIDTGKLFIRDGATISAAIYFGAGSGGTVTVNASDLVEISGRRPDSLIPSGLFASSGLEDAEFQATGPGGDMRIFTDRLIVSDGAQLAVSSVALGDAGNMEVVAREIEISNAGEITGATSAGQGGNLRLQTQDLRLRSGGNINTNAANTNGGNIAINTENLIALENSDITANALEGRGGQVRINATGIFGTQFRTTQTPLSDITATSNLGPQFSGTVDISTPDIDASAGLLELEQNIVDVARLIDENFCAVGVGSEFTVTGRGVYRILRIKCLTRLLC